MDTLGTLLSANALGNFISDIINNVIAFIIYFAHMCTRLAEGMLVSVEIFFCTLFFSLILGLFVAFGRMSKHFIIRFTNRKYYMIKFTSLCFMYTYCISMSNTR